MHVIECTENIHYTHTHSNVCCSVCILCWFVTHNMQFVLVFAHFELHLKIMNIYWCWWRYGCFLFILKFLFLLTFSDIFFFLSPPSPVETGAIIFGSDQEVREVMRAVRRNNATGMFSWIGSDGWSARNLVSDGNEPEVSNHTINRNQSNDITQSYPTMYTIIYEITLQTICVCVRAMKLLTSSSFCM